MSVEPPQPYNRLVASGCSATVLVGASGAVILQGHDGTAALLGFAGAVFLASVVVAPLLDAKRGGNLDGFLDQRADTGARKLALAILAMCTVGLLAAEITAGGWVLARLSGLTLPAASGMLLALMGLAAVAACLVGERQRMRVAWLDGVIAALISISLFAVVATIMRPGMAPGAGLLMEPALADIARLEAQLIEKRLADPALFKPHTVPFLRTNHWNFLALVACLSCGLALIWPMRVGSQTSWVRVGLLATIMPLLLLSPFTAEAKREMLADFAAGVRPSAVPDWLQANQALGGVQICGSASLDAGVLSKACGKGVGAQGLIRWHDAVFAPDGVAMAGLDALRAPALALLALGLGVVLAGVMLSVSLTGAVSQSLSAPYGSSAALVSLALIVGGALVAWLQIADSLTLVSWTASLALAGLGPVFLATCLFGPGNGRVACLAMIAGIAVTLVLTLAPRYLPLGVADVTGALSNAPPAILRRIVTLRDSAVTAASPEAKAAAILAAERLARDNIAWFGLKPIVSGIWGFMVSAGTLLVGHLAGGLLDRWQKDKA